MKQMGFEMDGTRNIDPRKYSMQSMKTSRLNKSPKESANFISKLLYWWILPLIRKGNKEGLTLADVYRVLPEFTSESLGNKLERNWSEEEIKSKVNGVKPSLKNALMKTFWKNYVLLCISRLVPDITLIGQAIFLTHCVEELKTHVNTPVRNKDPNKIDDSSSYLPYMCASGVCICAIVYTFTHRWWLTDSFMLGIKMRIALSSLVYRKTLKLKCDTKTSAAQIVNLVANDVAQFEMFGFYTPFLFSTHVMTAASIYVLWNDVGFSGLGGLGCIMALVPVLVFLGRKLSHVKTQMTSLTDERIQVTSEVISKIKIIKMFTWEDIFQNIINIIRRKELQFLLQCHYLQMFISFSHLLVSKLALFVIIISYVLLGYQLTVGKVFLALCITQIIRLPLGVQLPTAVNLLHFVSVSIHRLQDFLMLEEVNKRPFANPRGDHVQIMLDNIKCERGSDWWLGPLSIAAQKGKLVVIIGDIASGKTTLLQAILGELTIHTGEIYIRGNISYASQEPWIFKGSIRDNITIGKPYNEDKYLRVVSACALVKDFCQFPFGDLTDVGERGTMLSGGQKARINLARAAYQDADMYLLDDVLSAVDTRVASHLFTECVRHLLAGKTRVVVTHQLQFASEADLVVVLHQGIIKISGSYNDVMNSGMDLTALVGNMIADKEIDDIALAMSDGIIQSHCEVRKDSIWIINASYLRKIEEKAAAENANEPPSEMTGSGGKPLEALRDYFQSAASNFSVKFLLIFLFAAVQIVFNGTDFWLTLWASQPGVTVNHSPEGWMEKNHYLDIYACLFVIFILLLIIRSLYFFKSCLAASIRLHNILLNAVIRAPMQIFNQNASGAILNRFAKDISAIDDQIPMLVINWLQHVFLSLGSLILIIALNYWMIGPTLIFTVAACIATVNFLPAITSLKKLEAVARSPVYAHLISTYEGLTSIRVGDMEEFMRKQFEQKLDQNSSTSILFINSNDAMGLWLDIFGSVYVTCVAVMFVVFSSQDNPSHETGLALMSAINIIGMMPWGLRLFAEVLSYMVSVNRVMEYARLETEASDVDPQCEVKSVWKPQNGHLEFRNIGLKYKVGGPYVLKNVNFIVESKWKVGVVGRSGAGKSSLLAALFKLSPAEGDILIDHVNTNSLALKELRKGISVIPQDISTFSGTLRENLDPFNEFSDHQLWTALKKVQLDKVVSDLPAGLSTEISNSGCSLSTGQKQLICFCRSILQNSKILVLDEATANADPKTDSIVQRILETEFSNCTIITIAHRLHTIMSYDRVLVLENGTVVEFDEPYVLLQKSNGYFWKLVNQTGQDISTHLIQIATQSYHRRQQTGKDSDTEIQNTHL